MEALDEVEFCFPSFNNSCRKTIRTHLEATLSYTILSSITLLTVVLNLLVIISISHFRQLHTNTNLLLLSLAVSDFFVGFVHMPFEILHFQGCWILGDFVCAVNYFSAAIILTASVGNMVLISVDRYVAICDPMLYPTKVTVRRVQICICMCWILSVVHASFFLRDLLKQPGRYNTCYGECIVVLNFADGVYDLTVGFLAPFLIITVLYLRVFVVAVSQARAMRSHVTTVSQQRSGTVTAQKSELKAARTLGVVVAVFILCSLPYHCFIIAIETNLIEASTAGLQLWLIYFNSCLNPLIYTCCYPWFRKSVKHIVTLKILQPNSCETNIM